MEVMDEMEQQKPMPVFLKVLCILTFISTGFGLIGVLIGLLKGPDSASVLEKNAVIFVSQANEMREKGMSGLAHMMDQIVDMSYHINEHYYGNMLLSLFMVGTGLAGAILMWKGRKLGFHAYIAYCVLSAFGVYLFVPFDSVPLISPILGGIISLIFIFMYSRNLHWLK